MSYHHPWIKWSLLSKLFCSSSQDPPVLPVGQFSEKFVHFITQWWVSCSLCLICFVSRKTDTEIILINKKFCVFSMAVDCVVHLFVILVCTRLICLSQSTIWAPQSQTITKTTSCIWLNNCRWIKGIMVYNGIKVHLPVRVNALWL